MCSTINPYIRVSYFTKLVFLFIPDAYRSKYKFYYIFFCTSLHPILKMTALGRGNYMGRDQKMEQAMTHVGYGSSTIHLGTGISGGRWVG